VAPRKLPVEKQVTTMPAVTGFHFTPNTIVKIPGKTLREINGFHDGPDVRLVPIDELTRAYKNVMSRKSQLHHLSYVSTEGNYELRKVLAEYLNNTRGLKAGIENIFITRGSTMGVYMASRILLKKGDKVIVGQTSYYYADRLFMNEGAELVRVPVDEDGLVVDEVERICKKKKIRALFVTSHHHYPTTVTLSAARRMKLLALAEQYGFVIIEDDYDYDFHYNSSPILPLASADTKGMVVYVGTLTKAIAPALRIGYVIAPANFITELAKLRQLIDIQGDPFMEQAVAELFVMGDIKRHMKKALKEYHHRRDFLCASLGDKLSDVLNFKIPDGGMSIWTQFDKKVPVPELSEKLLRKRLVLSPGLIHDMAAGKKMNCTRLGFGWMNTDEAEKAVEVMYKTIKS
jgi:GntR family transcriptional regulator/MocR family aminotransferase